VSKLSPNSGLPREQSTFDLSAASNNMDSHEPYDARDEEAPPGVFFASVFQKALQDGLKIANKIVPTIEGMAAT